MHRFIGLDPPILLCTFSKFISMDLITDVIYSSTGVFLNVIFLIKNRTHMYDFQNRRYIQLTCPTIFGTGARCVFLTSRVKTEFRTVL